MACLRIERAAVSRTHRAWHEARLLDAKGPLLRPGETLYLPIRVVPPPGASTGDQVDVNVHGGLLPLVAGKRTAAGNGFTYQVVVP